MKPRRQRRKSDVPTVISPTNSLDSIDTSLPGVLTPPQVWIDSVKRNLRGSWDSTKVDKTLDMDWLSYCLQCLLTQDIVEKYDIAEKEMATKIITRDLIFIKKLKEVNNLF